MLALEQSVEKWPFSAQGEGCPTAPTPPLATGLQSAATEKVRPLHYTADVCCVLYVR